MRYYLRIFLKGHDNCQGEKLKVPKNSLLIESPKICPLAILMPLEENDYVVPQSKALISS